MTVELGTANPGIAKIVREANLLREKSSLLEDERQELFKSALEILRKEQVENYLRLGFHHSLGLSEIEYEKSMPNRISVPTNKTLEGFKFPVIVETRIFCEELFELAGINVGPGYNADYIFPGIFPPQQKPYVAWTREKQSQRGMSIEETMNKLCGNERAANIFEGVALVANYPEILRDSQLVFPKPPGGNFKFQDFVCLKLEGENVEFFIINKTHKATIITAQQGRA